MPRRDGAEGPFVDGMMRVLENLRERFSVSQKKAGGVLR
jgi:hypothetical protein